MDSHQLMPDWIRPGRWSLGRDPLGMQATSVRMYRELVPGLTNVTNRLRYYSYYCWVVSLWAKIRQAEDEQGWRLFIRTAEALYALASESVESTNGLAGSDWAREYWAGLKGNKIDLMPYINRPGENGQYLKAKRGNFGQFYIASMLEVKLLADSVSIPIVSKNGQALADVFATAIGEKTARELKAAINTGKLRKETLQEIGKMIHPSRIKANSSEMKLLRNFLWPQSDNIEGSKARRTSAWLLLDLARTKVDIFDQSALRQAFYQRTLPDTTHYNPGGKIIDQWRAYHANELCHIALEALLNGMARLIIESEAPGVVPRKLVNKLVKSVIPMKERKISWSQWAITANDGDPSAENELSEEVLDGLRRYRERADDPEVLLAAIKLLGILWHKWGTGAEQVQQEVERYSARAGASLSGVLATLREASNSTVCEAHEAVVRRHVIAEHLAIAGLKLAFSNNYTYRFVLEDGLLSYGVVAEYGFTNPRLRNLATFLVDAKLIDSDGEITEKGLELVNEFRPA